MASKKLPCQVLRRIVANMFATRTSRMPVTSRSSTMRSRVGPGMVASRLASWNGEVWNGLSASSAGGAGTGALGRRNGSFSASDRPAAPTPSAAGVS
jgi:hypothetical protein